MVCFRYIIVNILNKCDDKIVIIIIILSSLSHAAPSAVTAHTRCLQYIFSVLNRAADIDPRLNGQIPSLTVSPQKKPTVDAD
jgi:hypothetical protein